MSFMNVKVMKTARGGKTIINKIEYWKIIKIIQQKHCSINYGCKIFHCVHVNIKLKLKRFYFNGVKVHVNNAIHCTLEIMQFTVYKNNTIICLQE